MERQINWNVSGKDKKDIRIEELERQKQDDDAYIVGLDSRIADLEYDLEARDMALKDAMAEIERLRKALEGK